MLKRASTFYLPNFYLPRFKALLSVLLLGFAAAPSSFSQTATTTAQTPAQAQSQPPAKPIQPVTTTVVVQGHVADDYLPTSISVGSLDDLPLLAAPMSATVITRDLLSDQVSRLLSDVVKNDASIGEDYAPVGYYGDFQIRGFVIDLATGLQINGMPIAGEQDVPLENKEDVEFLKGIAGIESGITTAGGLIDYVTKRPALVKAIDLATDHRGTSYGAVDLGRLFGSQKQVGVRTNLAGERIKSFLNDADGWRAVGAGAADWKLNPGSILKTDFEYQHKVERDGSGYQLLGGTTLPDIDRIYTSTMLGEQSWSKPDTYDTLNTNARFDQELTTSWRAFAAASYSRSKIDDNVVYVYGCYYEAECNVPGGPQPFFFAPDGTYDMYDYRNPGELRIDAQAEAVVTGHWKTGAISQDLTAGGVLFRRSVQQPGAPPDGAPDNVQDGAVYTYVGSQSIYQPIAPVPLEIDPITGTPDQAGPQRLYEDNHQSAAVLQDRIHLPGRVQLLVGGRVDSLRDHNYSAHATDPTAPPVLTDKTVWLPQYAATWSPLANMTLYGNYSVMLSLGPQAPFWAENGSQFLAPFFTRQTEIGAKYEPDSRILLTTAFYRMRAPFFYPKVDPSDPTGASLLFLAEGHETHNGVELGAQGKAASWLRLSATASGILATSDDSGTPAFDGKQVINVPHVRTALFADIAMPRVGGVHLANLHLLPGWGYTGRKEATRDDAVSVDSYNLFNLGARYSPGGEAGRTTFRVYADNILNKRYWKDTGASYGDTFLWLGAPATIRASANYRFGHR
jgi:iron complex outermembrane receptor protein